MFSQRKRLYLLNSPIRFLMRQLRDVDVSKYPQIERVVACASRSFFSFGLFTSAVYPAYEKHVKSTYNLESTFRGNDGKQSAHSGSHKEADDGDEQTPSSLSSNSLTDPKTDFLHFVAHSRNWKRAYTCYLNTFNILYVLITLKSLVLISLDLRALASYRYLDCYLLGRYLINGRGSQGAKYVGLILTCCFLFARLLLTHNSAFCFHLDVLDFLMRGSAHVKRHANPNQLKRHVMLSATKEGRLEAHDFYYKQTGQLSEPTSFANYGHREDHTGASCELEHEPDPTLFATMNLLNTERFHVLKLTRSPSAWFWHCCLGAALIFGSIVFGCLWMLFFLFVMTPTVLTRRGFEYAYANCLDYLQHSVQDNATLARQYEHIYEPERVIVNSSMRLLYGHKDKSSWPIQLPLEDFASGSYHSVRIVFDYFESVLIQLDTIALLTSNVLFIMHAGFDLMANADLIRCRLASLSAKLAQTLAQQEAATSARLPRPTNISTLGSRPILSLEQEVSHLEQVNYHTHNRSPAPPEDCVERHEQFLEITHLQALLLDHFRTTSRYNQFVTYYCLLISAIWLLYSSVILTWRSFAGGGQLEPELYAAILGAGCLMLSLLVGLSMVCSRNKRFYKQVTSLMAQDYACPPIINKRWTIILDHYHPKPMFCFSLISTEISYLLVLKLIAWFISALSVIISFINMRGDATLADKQNISPADRVTLL